MSKKIIYLLSLLMALSLVFASCKKNSGLDPTSIGGGINNEDNIGDTAGDDGLYDSFDQIPTIEKPLVTYKVFTLNGTETYRNSVVVSMGKSGQYILVLSENRYTSTTSVNDIALDGKTITDIVYNLNTASGKEEAWRGRQVVGTTAGTDPKNSRAAIVVFKVDATHVVVVASQGAGISRVSEDYANRKWADNSELKSNLQYTVGTLNETDGTINWTTWADIKVNDQSLSSEIEKLNFTDSAGNKFAQFGTHSGRGFVKDSTIYVPIILATQGNSSNVKELMGNIILTGQFSGDNITTWTLGDKIAFDQISGKAHLSKQKESRVYDVGTDGKAKYLTVPNGQADSADKFLFAGTAGEKPQKTIIPAGDGSVGILKLKWYGSTGYDVANYATENASSADRFIVMHVRQPETQLYINLTDVNLSNIEKSVFINDNGKASSVDVLPDGTIITLAEEGLASGTAQERKFNVVFKRYSQAYLDSIMK